MHELVMTDPWNLGEGAFAVVKQAFASVVPRRILEFGSGVSTVRLALAFPEATIVTFDHLPLYARRTLELARRYGVASRVNLRLRPVRPRFVGGAPYWTYADMRLEGEFDAVLVDGPPGHLPGGREACFYLAYPHLREGGVAVLDDSERRGERRAVRHWIATYPGLSLERHATEHGIAVIVKRAAEGPRWARPRLVESWAVAARWSAARTRDRVTGTSKIK